MPENPSEKTSESASTAQDPGSDTQSEAAPGKVLPPEALRALEEAAQRRAAHPEPDPTGEINGPRGLEPTRYGDWERKGVASDF